MLLPQKFVQRLPTILLATALIGSLACKEVYSSEINDLTSNLEESLVSRQIQQHSENLLQREELDHTIQNLLERDPKSNHRSRKFRKHKKTAAKNKHGKSRNQHQSKTKKGDRSSSKHPAAATENAESDYTHPSSKGNKPSLTPNGIKAGIAGGQSLPFIKNAIGWFTEWTPTPYGSLKNERVEFATMMWGLGLTGHDDDKKRFEEFKKIPPGKYKYVIGMNEPDFSGGGSSGVIATSRAAEAWDQYIAPHGKAGSLLISPSCAKQQDENWMGPFLDKVKTKPDVVNVHIFKNKASEIKQVLDHFAKYGYPMWVTELACINYSNGAHGLCSQADADEFVREAVKILEADDRVKAYAWSDADNGPACTLTKNGGKALSKTGQTLKSVFASFAKRDFEDS